MRLLLVFVVVVKVVVEEVLVMLDVVAKIKQKDS